MYIHLDFESWSCCDLIKRGTYCYAADPTTDINCMAWAIDDGPVELWEPGDDIPEAILNALNRGDLILSWNANFERLIWNNVLTRYGFPPLPIERFYCIAALSRARGFPGALEKAGRFAELYLQKDMEGYYLMLKLCKPRRTEDDGTIIKWDHPDDYRRLGEYCKRDVEVERAMFELFIPFTDQELADYHLSEEINDRGVMVDLELAKAAVIGVQSEKIDCDDAIKSYTNGAVTAHTQVEKILNWVEQEWKKIPSLNKSDVLDALAEDDIPPAVADVLELRLNNARAAVSKFAAMLERNVHGVVKGLFMYRGAGQTGRFTSMGLQIQNLVSDSRVDAIPILKKYGIKGLKMLGEPVNLLAQMVRPAFMASPGRKFLIGDFAQIEARITAWLAGEEQLLILFRKGKSPYAVFGTKVLGREVSKSGTPTEYKVFKACILGLGFGGAEGALARSMKKEQIILPAEKQTEYVQAYRGTYTRIKALWYALNNAVLLAMRSPGTIVPVSYVQYLFDGLHLWCKLPSGRYICYPYAQVVEDEWGDSVEYRRGNRTPKSGVTEWPTVRLWHGMEIENLAQAIAFDLLMGAMRRLSKWDIRLHVHDEIVVEVDSMDAEELLPIFLAEMSRGEEWAEGLPIMAEGKISERYVK